MHEKGMDWSETWNVIQNEDLGRQVNALRNENAYLKRHLGDKSLTPIQALRMLYGTGPESTPSQSRMQENDHSMICQTVPAIRHENRTPGAANYKASDESLPFRGGKSARRSLGGELNLASDTETVSPLQERILQDIGNRNPMESLSPPKNLPKPGEVECLEEQVENAETFDIEEENAEAMEPEEKNADGTSIQLSVEKFDSLDCVTLSDNFFAYNQSEEEITSKETASNNLADKRLLLVKGRMMYRLTYFLLGFLALAGSILVFFRPPHQSPLGPKDDQVSCKEEKMDGGRLHSQESVAKEDNVQSVWGRFEDSQDNQLPLKPKRFRIPTNRIDAEVSTEIIPPALTEQLRMQIGRDPAFEHLPYPCFSALGLPQQAGSGIWLPATISMWAATACATGILGWLYLRLQRSNRSGIAGQSKFRRGRGSAPTARHTSYSDQDGDRSGLAVEEDMYPDVIPDTGTYSVLRKSVVRDHVTVTPLRRSARLTPAGRPGLSRYSLAEAFDDVRTPPSYLAYDVEQSVTTLGKTPRRSRRLADKYYQKNHLAS